MQIQMQAEELFGCYEDYLNIPADLPEAAKVKIVKEVAEAVVCSTALATSTESESLIGKCKGQRLQAHTHCGKCLQAQSRRKLR